MGRALVEEVFQNIKTIKYVQPSILLVFRC